MLEWIFMGTSFLLLAYIVYAKILEPLSAGMMLFTFIARRYFGPVRSSAAGADGQLDVEL
jgi:hypothetical protein